MNFPNDVKYTKEHEWIRLEGDVAYVGITDYAQRTIGRYRICRHPNRRRNIGSR